MSGLPDTLVFRSEHHPGHRSKAAVAGSALVRPLGFCMMPIMVGALFTMLQGFPALSWLTIGFPLAAACATVWTWHSIRSSVVEVVVAQDRVATLSLFEAAEPVSGIRWKWVIDLRVAPDHAMLTLGLSPIRLNRSEWPEWGRLLDALHSAYQLQSEAIRPA